MAPDKIYTDNRGVYAEIPVFSQADANVEYIRKDYLLEILKPSLSLYKDRYDPMWIEGRNFLRSQLIDKLNTL